MNLNISMDCSGDELINSTLSLLEMSQDIVNMAPMNGVCSSADDNSFDRHFSRGK